MSHRKFSYLRRYEDPHKGLMLIRRACVRVGLQMIRMPMHSPFTSDGPLATRIGEFLGRLMGHVGLIGQVRRHGGSTMVVREFLTVPLFVVAPFLWPRRRSIWLFCQHNIGLSVNNRLHRTMMRLLYAAGFNFLVYDTVEVFAPIAPPRPGRVVAVPFPVPEIALPDAPARVPGEITIGFVGAFRPEKSPEWAIRCLADLIAAGKLPPQVRLLVGNDDDRILADWADVARTVNTDSYADFLRTLSQCDILVLPLRRAALPVPLLRRVFRSGGAGLPDRRAGHPRPARADQSAAADRRLLRRSRRAGGDGAARHRHGSRPAAAAGLRGATATSLARGPHPGAAPGACALSAEGLPRDLMRLQGLPP